MHSPVMITSPLFSERGKLPASKLSRRISNLLKCLLHLVALGIYKLMVLRNMFVICMDLERRISIMFVMSYFSASTPTIIRIIDLSLLPPCQLTLKLNVSRANVVAKISKSAKETNVDIRDAALEGWDENIQIHWLDNAFPENVIDILMDPDFDSIDDDMAQMKKVTKIELN